MLAGPSPALAAIDELVTTTARGRTEAVRDVPATIAVISREDIESAGIERVENFINLVPGVTIVDAAEAAIPRSISAASTAPAMPRTASRWSSTAC
ncbi:MAG: hypothetical protein DWQ08_03330 [Proteobacteria bacterium]|nr:MAG: hypothetical protein DWQ08_03330 [Pseudomonadota bacterium]